MLISLRKYLSLMSSSVFIRNVVTAFATNRSPKTMQMNVWNNADNDVDGPHDTRCVAGSQFVQTHD